MNNENTVGSSQAEFAAEPRVYELGYLVMPTVDEGDLGEERDALVALITKSKGIVIDEGNPVLIDLAYDMEKMIKNKKHTFTQAYFGWIKFDVAPSDVEALDTEIDAQENLVRYLLVKTVRENTLTSDQPFKLAKSSRDTDTEEDVIEKSVEEVTEEVTSNTEDLDDLTKIEGIGPVIAETLATAGITTFEALANAKDEDVQEMIKEVRGSHDATTWNEQAVLARDGKWDELKELQDKLDGGVEK